MSSRDPQLHPAGASPAAPPPSPLAVAQALADRFATTAAERDERGGTPKAERDALRASGLLSLSIPAAQGGQGADWATMLQTVRTLAQADSSVAHVYGFHHLLLATVQLFARPDQWVPWLEQTARKQWFWGNALNPLDTRTAVRRVDDWYDFSGKKSFCSGALDSEMLVASGIDERTGQLLIAAIPTARAGITLNGDWNCMGQRQTDSGSALFENVRVEAGELLRDPGPLTTPRSSLRPLLAQLIFVHVFLGLAEGAFAQARHYTLNESRPWFRSGAERASEDPYIQSHYGEFFVGLESVRLLAAHAAATFDAAWNQGDALDAEGRGRVAVAVATAKVASTRVGLDVTSRLFETTGARATHGALRLDRFWRNLRTQTLHDPVDYKLQELGDWALHGTVPSPSFYS
ncbi:acyl-CoA dehydrogenase family protein [Paracidovorax wautersii]|uniref:Alkylation response protein AidB-like acyl-CoA dehydrogenase n=1 Tax=Paracidovorax wautersii TaxID=1177982 RepID=A0ABU1I852_9BURK|nr:acyl-CoA dehydrogenase family protein [Paracidovorax wautersii]MDR6213401.1 alkylation response protein AidB-like acyl-CoA dehydrogenase [Paracidovorax wautersii]